jgi:hypothetical protein
LHFVLSLVSLLNDRVNSTGVLFIYL